MMVQKNDMKEMMQGMRQRFEDERSKMMANVERVSDLLRRAIEAFEEGNIERANTLLDEIAHEADRHMEQLEQQRNLVHQDIDAFQLQAKALMADVKIPIEERIHRVAEIYAKADDWAERSALEKEKYIDLLEDYSSFLIDYALYDKARSICLKLISQNESTYGAEHPDTATSYSNIGAVYSHQGTYDKALEYYFKALAIREKVLGTEHPVLRLWQLERKY